MLSKKIKNILLKEVDWNNTFLLSNIAIGSMYFLGFLAIVHNWIIFTADSDGEMALGSLVFGVIFTGMSVFFVMLNGILKLLQNRSIYQWPIVIGLVLNTFLFGVNILITSLYTIGYFAHTGFSFNL